MVNNYLLIVCIVVLYIASRRMYHDGITARIILEIIALLVVGGLLVLCSQVLIKAIEIQAELNRAGAGAF